MTPFEPDNEAQTNLPVPARAPRRNDPAYPALPWNGETTDGGEAPSAAPAVGSALSFHNLLKGFRHRWPLAVAAGLSLGLALAAGVWFLLPAQYTAYALLRVASTEPHLLPDGRGRRARTAKTSRTRRWRCSRAGRSSRRRYGGRRWASWPWSVNTRTRRPGLRTK